MTKTESKVLGLVRSHKKPTDIEQVLNTLAEGSEKKSRRTTDDETTTAIRTLLWKRVLKITPDWKLTPNPYNLYPDKQL